MVKPAPRMLLTLVLALTFAGCAANTPGADAPGTSLKACPREDPGGEAHVHGRVTDSSGNPLRKAEVTIAPVRGGGIAYSRTTDESGCYRATVFYASNAMAAPGSPMREPYDYGLIAHLVKFRDSNIHVGTLSTGEIREVNVQMNLL
jgi:hypothetical protein